MKPNLWLWVFFMAAVLFKPLEVEGQKKDLNYGKTPDKFFPYNNFQKAYKYHFLEPIEFYGAGRDKLAPKDLTEVRLGFLGPLEGSPLVSLGEQMLNGTTLAIEQANSNGGYKGLPFKLMIHNDVGLWGAAANEVVKMDDDSEEEFGPGDAFYMPPGHDAWIVGDEPCVLIDVTGFGQYAKPS